MEDLKDILGMLLIIVIFLAIAMLIFNIPPAGWFFFNEDDMTMAVEKQGYEVQEVTDTDVFFVSWRGCGNSDRMKWEVNAKNPKGIEVDIIVCTDLFKAYTVRTE